MFPLAGMFLLVYGGYVFARRGDESPIYMIGSFVLISIGVFLYSRVKVKREGHKKLIVRRKKSE